MTEKIPMKVKQNLWWTTLNFPSINEVYTNIKMYPKMTLKTSTNIADDATSVKLRDMLIRILN